MGINGVTQTNLNYLTVLKGASAKNSASSNPVSQPYYNSYKDFPASTNSSSPMSDDKFKESIIAQAKKDVASGKIGGESAGCMKLLNEFRSVVSPDRHSIISDSFKNFSQSLLAFDKLGFMEFFSSSGEVIASFIPGRGWSTIATKAENQRTSEYYGIYMQAVREAVNGKQNNSSAKTAATQDMSSGTIDVSV